MQFECQQSGHCCLNPAIIVTLTYRDLYLLYLSVNKDFNELLKQISFYKLPEVENAKLQNQMVVPPIQTGEGLIIPGLRKNTQGACVYYSKPICTIYEWRPMACRNYPIAFKVDSGSIQPIWVKNAVETCPGIGQPSGISSEEILQMGEQFFKEMAENSDLNKNISLEAAQGNPLSAREALWVVLAFADSQLKEELGSD